MGIPAGLIGPQLFIGACLGGIISIVGHYLFPDSISNNGIYVLLGMAAMMGAVLNAPLAALMAVLELTYNPGIIFPSMLIIVVACVVTRQLYQCEGIFVEQLNLKGTRLDVGPIQQILNNIGVRSAMNTAFVETATVITKATANHLLTKNPLWVVIHTEEQHLLLKAADLAIAIKTLENDADQNQIDLLEIPGERLNLMPIAELYNLFEAKKILDKQQGGALFVSPQIQTTPNPQVIGIITTDTIANYYM